MRNRCYTIKHPNEATGEPLPRPYVEPSSVAEVALGSWDKRFWPSRLCWTRHQNWRLCARPSLRTRRDYHPSRRKTLARDPDGLRHCDEGRPSQRGPRSGSSRARSTVFDSRSSKIYRPGRAAVVWTARTERCSSDGPTNPSLVLQSPQPTGHRCHAVGLRQHRLCLAENRCHRERSAGLLTKTRSPMIFKSAWLRANPASGPLPDPQQLDCSVSWCEAAISTG